MRPDSFHSDEGGFKHPEKKSLYPGKPSTCAAFPQRSPTVVTNLPSERRVKESFVKKLKPDGSSQWSLPHVGERETVFVGSHLAIWPNDRSRTSVSRSRFNVDVIVESGSFER